MFEAVVIGTSAGGIHALKKLLSDIPASFSASIAIVQHIQERADGYLVECFSRASKIPVKEADDKEKMQPGMAYVAPAGYHLLVEPDRSFSLSVDEKVNYCRPSIDLLFESAADVFGKSLIGVVLTGANGDGANGLKFIKEQGGVAIVQSPKDAEFPFMPQAAINATEVDHMLKLEKIAPLLVELTERKMYGTGT